MSSIYLNPKLHKLVMGIGLCATLSGCSSFFKPSESDLSDANMALYLNCSDADVKPIQPKKERKSPLGNPTQYEVFNRAYFPMNTMNKGFSETGFASWYGPKFKGQKTSTGEIFNPCELTAAHRLVPIPSYFLVENLENGRRIVVKVNDRGPFVNPDERIIDLSYMSARKLGFVDQGTARVKITSLVEHESSNPIDVIQAGSFKTLETAENGKESIARIPAIKDEVSLVNDNGTYKLFILAKNQSMDELRKILNSYKIDHFVTTIHRY